VGKWESEGIGRGGIVPGPHGVVGAGRASDIFCGMTETENLMSWHTASIALNKSRNMAGFQWLV